MSMGLPMGLAMASGLNTYLPLFALALFARYGNVVEISPKFQWLTSDQTIVVLAILVLVEVLADKFPGLDHVWDFIHTLLRPVAGALAAGATVTTDNIFEMAVVMLTGGSLAAAAHAAKASVRLVSTSKSMGVANPILSIVEDITSLVATLVSVFFPWLMAIIAVLFIATVALLGPPLFRTLRFNMGVLGGALKAAARRLLREPAPRELSESLVDISPGRISRLRGLLKDGEELEGALEGWRRTGWAPRRAWLLITPRHIVLAERRFLGRLKTRTIPYSELVLVKERTSLLLARLESVTRENQNVTLLLPKTQSAFAALATRRISELAGLSPQPGASQPAKLAPATL